MSFYAHLSVYIYILYVILFEGAKSYSRAHFGEGSGSIFLDDVICLGSESSLLQCYHRPIGNHDCTHIEDASVSCSSMFYLNCFIQIYQL